MKKASSRKRKRLVLDSLSLGIHSAGISTVLSVAGLHRPVPPPLWINVVQLSCVIVYHEWAICQYENTQESCRFKMMLCKSYLLNRRGALPYSHLDKGRLSVYNLKQIINVVDERNEYIRLWQLQRADGSESSAQTGG